MEFPGGGNLWRRNLYYPFTFDGPDGGRLQSIRLGKETLPNYSLYLACTCDAAGNVATLYDRESWTMTMTTGAG